MLEVVTAQVPGQCQIIFNISNAVGVGSPNDRIDVELVQLGYFCSALNPANTASPDVKAIWRLVKPGAGYSGLPTDPLSKAIEEHERSKGIKVDGHISRMHGGLRYNGGPRGSEPFLLVALCNNIFDVMADVYPRIDLDKRCPGNLAVHIKKLLRN
ncbi:MAG: hypothetical protein WCL32_17150 [Planctomycetota bacterium]|jgi:hypothetical protein